jgi:hypothetical protein
MAEPDLGHLIELSQRLEETAERLRVTPAGEEASRLAGECAALAAEAAAELDRLAKAGAGEDLSGQEELL